MCRVARWCRVGHGTGLDGLVGALLVRDLLVGARALREGSVLVWIGLVGAGALSVWTCGLRMRTRTLGVRARRLGLRAGVRRVVLGGVLVRIDCLRGGGRAVFRRRPASSLFGGLTIRGLGVDAPLGFRVRLGFGARLIRRLGTLLSLGVPILRLLGGGRCRLVGFVVHTQSSSAVARQLRNVVQTETIN